MRIEGRLGKGRLGGGDQKKISKNESEKIWRKGNNHHSDHN